MSTMTGTIDAMDYSTLSRGVDEEDNNAVRDRAIEIIDIFLRGNNAIELTVDQINRLVDLLSNGDQEVGEIIRSELRPYIILNTVDETETNAFMDQILAEEARHADIREIDLPLEDGTLLHPLRNPSSIVAGAHMRKIIEKKKKPSRTERLIRLEKDD